MFLHVNKNSMLHKLSINHTARLTYAPQIYKCLGVYLSPSVAAEYGTDNSVYSIGHQQNNSVIVQGC